MYKWKWVLIIVSISIVSVQAKANEAISRIMATCQPDIASIQKKTCRTGGHGVFHSGAIGSCRMLCNIQPSERETTWNDPLFFGKDPDGEDDKYRIVAKFKSAKVGERRTKTISTVDSNFVNPDPNAPNVDPEVLKNYRPMSCRGFSTRRTDNTLWYWVDVEITRQPGATEEVEALGFRIEFR